MFRDSEQPVAKGPFTWIGFPAVHRGSDRAEDLLHEIKRVGVLKPLPARQSVNQRRVNRREFGPGGRPWGRTGGPAGSAECPAPRPFHPLFHRSLFIEHIAGEKSSQRIFHGAATVFGAGTQGGPYPPSFHAGAQCFKFRTRTSGDRRQGKASSKHAALSTERPAVSHAITPIRSRAIELSRAARSRKRPVERFARASPAPSSDRRRAQSVFRSDRRGPEAVSHPPEHTACRRRGKRFEPGNSRSRVSRCFNAEDQPTNRRSPSCRAEELPCLCEEKSAAWRS